MDARARQLSSSALLVLLAFTCNLGGSPGARLIVWAPLLFLAPGYLLAALLFKTDRLAAVLTGVVLSLCLDICGGLALGFVGQISLVGWSVWFCLLYGGCLFIHGRASPVIQTEATIAQPPLHRVSFTSPFALTLSACILMIGTAYWIAMRSEAADSQFSFVEFWMLPAESPAELALGITNAEESMQAFRIEVSTDGVTTAAWTTDRVAPGKTIHSKIAISPTAQRVIARLYRSDDPTRIIRLVSVDPKPARVGGAPAQPGRPSRGDRDRWPGVVPRRPARLGLYGPPPTGPIA